MDSAKKSFSDSDIRITSMTRVDITGVDEIFSYDDRSIVLSVCGTKTVVEGEELRVTVLSVEDGRISAVGRINGVVCEEDISPKKGFLSRLVKG